MKFNRKKKKSPRQWLNEIQYNFQRLGRLVLRGNPQKIFFPDKEEGKNNLQHIVEFSNKMLNTALKQTVNKSATEVIETAKDIPKDLTKNLICLAPNIIRKFRQMNAMEEPSFLQRKHLNLYSTKG